MASRKIGALWAKQSKDGSKQFLSGVIQDLRGDIHITIFKNDRKEKKGQPDYNIVVSDDREGQPEQKKDDFFQGAEIIQSDDMPPMPNDQDEVKVENIPF